MASLYPEMQWIEVRAFFCFFKDKARGASKAVHFAGAAGCL